MIYYNLKLQNTLHVTSSLGHNYMQSVTFSTFNASFSFSQAILLAIMVHLCDGGPSQQIDYYFFLFQI